MIKTTVLTAFLSLCAIQIAFAQTNQGSIMAGLHNFNAFAPGFNNPLATSTMLGFAFGTLKSDFAGVKFEDEYTVIGISGNFHYFMINNLSAGVSMNYYGLNIKEQDSDFVSKTQIFMVGPELRGFISAGSKSKVYVGGGAGWGSLNIGSSEQEDDSPVKLSRYGGVAGIAFFPNEHFSIDLGLGYNVFTATEDMGVLGKNKDTYSG
ncbi:MAG: hypothetical protein JNJ57_21175, partial [Saprospiraceae bacterium]|nr:hypothetical protein [Saprospiraceae bacterium]